MVLRLLDVMKAVATRVPLTKSQAKEVTQAALVTILAALQRGERVKIEGLGSLRSQDDGSFVFDGGPLEVDRVADEPFLAKKQGKLAFDYLLARLNGEVIPESWLRIGTSSTDLWAKRAKIAARFIRPGDVVADIGCGGMALEAFLPEGCTYMPFDITARDERTVIIDLDVEPRLPPFKADVITCLGVIEHLRDRVESLRVFRERADRLILTFNPKAQESHPIFERLNLHRGEVFGHENVVSWLAEAGWILKEQTPASGGQIVYICE